MSSEKDNKKNNIQNNEKDMEHILNLCSQALDIDKKNKNNEMVIFIATTLIDRLLLEMSKNKNESN